MDLQKFKSKLAIVILSFADYESLELTMATHAKFTVDSGVHIYILQNGRKTYDCERTYAVAQRYHYLFPDVIDVIDDIPQGTPYDSLRTLFASAQFAKYEHIIKLDDDVLVLTPDWVDRLCETYLEQSAIHGEKLAYVTTLVDNNPFGFQKIIEASEELRAEYFETVARRHFVGNRDYDPWVPYRLIEADEIYGGGNGTVWRNPHIARWLHKRLSMRPEQYIKLSAGMGLAEVHNKERYSINCILFERKLWEEMYDGGTDDEHMFQAYCLRHNKRIIANLTIPMVHLFFGVQRDEGRDLMPQFRSVYAEYLNLPFPITGCDNRQIETENRLRHMEELEWRIIRQEKQLDELKEQLQEFRRAQEEAQYKSRTLFSYLVGGIRCVKDHGLGYTVRRFFGRGKEDKQQ